MTGAWLMHNLVVAAGTRQATVGLNRHQDMPDAGGFQDMSDAGSQRLSQATAQKVWSSRPEQ